MSTSPYTLRRAVVDDLPALRQMWGSAGFPAHSLEKRFTEFQVIEQPQKGIAGAIGLHIEGSHGQIHSESYASQQDKELFRQTLWDRLQNVAHNHGLTRVWVLNGDAFWKDHGFQRAVGDLPQQIPPSFGDPQDPWMSLQIRDEPDVLEALEREMTLFEQQREQRSENLRRTARILRLLAALSAFAVLLLILILIFFSALQAPETANP